MFSHGVEVGRFVGELKAVGVEFSASVPDSLLKSFCMYVTDTCVVKKSYSTTSTPPMGDSPFETLSPLFIRCVSFRRVVEGIS